MPNTPPPSAPVPLSTPPSNGAGSNAAHKMIPTQTAYRPYLTVDIAPSPSIPFKDFLSVIFPQGDKYPDLGMIRARISNDAKFKELIKTYAEKDAAEEEDRYEPFNSLVNRMFELLGQTSQEDIVITRNDPGRILGSASIRKPDCVVVHQKAMEYGDRTNVDNMSKKGPPKDGNFHWSELLAFVEFKLVNNIAKPEEAAPPPEKAAPPAKKAADKKPKQLASQSKSAQEKSNSGPSNSGTTRGTSSFFVHYVNAELMGYS
jgi:hypothetical protein